MSAAFEIGILRAQAAKIREKKEFDIAPSRAELRTRVTLVKSWIEGNGLTPEDKADAETWLANVAQLEGVDEDIRATAGSALTQLKSSVELGKLNPKEKSARILDGLREIAKDPQRFDEFITTFMRERSKLSETQAILEFHRLWNELIVTQ